MKKIFLCAFALGCFAVSNAQDFRTDELEQQEPVDTTSTVVEPAEQQTEIYHSELDSHQQAVNVPQSQLDDRNRKDKLRSIWEKRSTFFNIGYVNETLTNKMDNTSWGDMKSEYGAFISIGHSYYIPRKPIGGVVKFGIDATWLDINYAYFDKIRQETGIKDKPLDSFNGIPLNNVYEPTEFGHHISAGMGLGVSLTVNPVDHLKIAGYFHVVPTYNAIIVESEKVVYLNQNNTPQFNDCTEILHGYTTMMKFGGTIAYKAISLGIESRSGSGTFRYEETDKIVQGTSDKQPKYKTKFKIATTRFFIGFRF